MEPREHLLRKGVDPVHDRLRPRIRGPCLALLLIGEGQRAEREDLVDLARVEQVTGAFGRHAGVVVHDDRGRQHHVPPARGARQHGERVQVAAVPSRPPTPIWADPTATRTSRPAPPTRNARRQGSGGAPRRAARRRPGRSPCSPRSRAACAAGTAPWRPRPTAAAGPTAAGGFARTLPPSAVSPNSSISSPPGRVTGSTCSCSPSSAGTTATSNSLGTASSKVRWRSPPISSSSTSTNSPSAALRCTERRCGCRNRSRTRSRARGLRLEQALGALSPRVRRARNRLLDRSARLDPLARGEHTELPANPVLRRRPPIRVEQVALVEHRVRHRARRLPTRRRRPV